MLPHVKHEIPPRLVRTYLRYTIRWKLMSHARPTYLMPRMTIGHFICIGTWSPFSFGATIIFWRYTIKLQNKTMLITLIFIQNWLLEMKPFSHTDVVFQILSNGICYFKQN